jgi:hypothetical protein
MICSFHQISMSKVVDWTSRDYDSNCSICNLSISNCSCYLHEEHESMSEEEEEEFPIGKDQVRWAKIFLQSLSSPDLNKIYTHQQVMIQEEEEEGNDYSTPSYLHLLKSRSRPIPIPLNKQKN